MNAAFGASLAHCDINGDGLEDVVIGDPQADEETADDLHGAAHVFLAQAGAFPQSPDQTLYGVTQLDNFGSDVSALGDVNGDGFDDVAISAYVSSDWSGQTSVYFGTPTGLEETPSRVFTGEYANAGVHGSAVGDATSGRRFGRFLQRVTTMPSVAMRARSAGVRPSPATIVSRYFALAGSKPSGGGLGGACRARNASTSAAAAGANGGGAGGTGSGSSAGAGATSGAWAGAGAGAEHARRRRGSTRTPFRTCRAGSW